MSFSPPPPHSVFRGAAPPVSAVSAPVVDSDDEEGAPAPALPFVSLPTFLANPDNEDNEDQARQFALHGVSLEKAKRFRDLTCPRLRDSEGKPHPYPIWSTPLREFKRFGLGTLLYFQLLRSLSFIYLIMFVIAMPSFLFNLQGNALSSDSLGVGSTTLGNQGTVVYQYINTTGYIVSESSTVVSNSNFTLDDNLNNIYGFPRKFIGILTTLLDLFYVFFYIAFIIFLTWSHRREGRKYHDDILTVSRYAVAVYDIPPHCHDRVYLRNFFSRYGQVIDVCIAYNNYDLIQLYKKRGDLKKRMIAAEVAGKKSQRDGLGKSIMKIDQQIATYQSHLKLEARVAYVVFHLQEEAEKCLKSYPDEFLFHHFMPRYKRLYERYKIRVRAAPEPSNILYENLQYSKRQKSSRRFLTFLATVVLMSASIAIVWVAAYYQGKIPQPYQCDLEGYPTTYSSSMTTDQLYCYCSSLSTAELIAGGDCGSYISARALRDALVFVTSVAVVVVNGVIAFFTSHISKIEAHSSRTSQQTAMAKKLAVGLFINMGIIVLLVNADLSPLFGTNLGLQFFFAGQFDDVSSTWFSVVGLAIIFTMAINIFDPHCWHMVYSWFLDCRRGSCFDKTLIPRGKITQEKLNKKFEGHTFTLAKRYAVALSNLFVIMMYSSGMPLLLLIGMCSSSMTYWVDKYLFYRMYKMPPRYDENLDEMATSLMPWAVVLHCIMAIWFYSSPCTESYVVSTSYLTPIVSSTKIATLNIQDRILQWNTFPFFLLLCVMFALFLGKELIDICCCSRHHVSSVQPVNNEIKFNARMRSAANEDVRPSYFEAANRIRFESYRVNEQPQFKSAYMVTRSLLQLAPDKEFSDVKYWFQQVRKHELLPDQDRLEVGAGFISREVEENDGAMVSRKSDGGQSKKQSWGTVSSKKFAGIRSLIQQQMATLNSQRSLPSSSHRKVFSSSSVESVQGQQGHGRHFTDLGVQPIQEDGDEKEGRSPLMDLPPIQMAVPEGDAVISLAPPEGQPRVPVMNAPQQRSGPPVADPPPMLNRWMSQRNFNIPQPASSPAQTASEIVHQQQLSEYGINANRYGAGTIIPFTCEMCRSTFGIKDYGVVAQYKCPMPKCGYEFVV